MPDPRSAYSTDRITSWCQEQADDSTLEGRGATTAREEELLNGLACWTSACEVRCGQSGTGSGFSPRSVFPCHDQSTIACTHLSFSTGGIRINVLSFGTLKKQRSFWKWGWRCIANV